MSAKKLLKHTSPTELALLEITVVRICPHLRPTVGAKSEEENLNHVQ
jgi:hypothetical protein